MKEIGVHEAKTHLSAILQRVKAGEEFIITHRGEPVAELRAPVKKPEIDPVQAFEELRAAFRKNPPGTLEEMLVWRREGLE